MILSTKSIIANLMAEENPLVILETEPGDRSPQSSSLDYWLESLYGALFTPQATFTYLRSHPSAIAGTILVALVNTLEALRLGGGIWAILLTVCFGLLGWVIFAFLLKTLAQVLGRDVKLDVLLTLIGFGSVPWLFIAPALSLGGVAGRLVAIAVMLWFVVWQVWATAIALEVNRWRLFLIVPLAIYGGFASLLWAGNIFKLLFSIGNV
jgi:hypothetical protein